MTANEKLQHLIREVAHQMALRGLPEQKRPKDWALKMRDANARVAGLLVEYGDLDDVPHLPPLPLPAPPAGDLSEIEIPPVPPLPSAEQPAEKPKRKARGGQHND